MPATAGGRKLGQCWMMSDLSLLFGQGHREGVEGRVAGGRRIAQ